MNIKKIIGLSLLLGIAGLGFIVKQNNPTPYLIIPRQTLYNFIVYSNHLAPASHFELNSTFYACPTENWLTNIFTKEYKKFLKLNKLNKYEEESNDCDHFVNYAISVANYTFQNDKYRPLCTGLALGEFCYTVNIDTNGHPWLHAINFIVVHDDVNKFRIIFYEPQAQEVRKLDIIKIIMCYSWHI